MVIMELLSIEDLQRDLKDTEIQLSLIEMAEYHGEKKFDGQDTQKALKDFKAIKQILEDQLRFRKQML